MSVDPPERLNESGTACRLPPPGMYGTLTRATADDVDRLVDELESTLDAKQRRLLHQVRLAAESLGALRAASMVRGGY